MNCETCCHFLVLQHLPGWVLSLFNMTRSFFNLVCIRDRNLVNTSDLPFGAVGHGTP